MKKICIVQRIKMTTNNQHLTVFKKYIRVEKIG